MRALALFVALVVVHFALSVAGLAMILPAAFETQGGNFWAAPGKAILAWLPNVLLAPLAFAPSDFGFVEVALVSVLWGAVAVALLRLRRALAAARPDQ